MRIFYDKEKSMELMERIQNKFGEENKYQRGTDIHVSDLCYCLMKIYCRIIGIERKQTKASIGVMVFGIIAETILGWTYPKETLQYKSNMPMLSEEENVFGHIDIFEEFKYPLEVKASRKQVFMANQIPPQWMEQLISYMAMEGCKQGWLVIFNVFSTQIMAFQIQLTEQDVIDWLIILQTRRVWIIRIVSVTKTNPKLGEELMMKLEIRPDEYGFCDYSSGCPRSNECYKKSREIAKQKAENKKVKKSATRYDPFNSNRGDSPYDKMQANLESIEKTGKELTGEK